MKKLKIAIVVHGRFHAFDLVKALLAQGHNVTLFTNYPKWAVARFGISKAHVRSFWLHGVVSRIFYRLSRYKVPFPEATLHRWFGKWADRTVLAEDWDAIRSWSGISEELLNSIQTKPNGIVFLTRGSAHISTQDRLLSTEEKRVGKPMDRPSNWMIQRELREYALTEKILTLSTFARKSFMEEGINAQKVVRVQSGIDTSNFKASESEVVSRCRRILTGQPLRILNIGTFSYQKGIFDINEVIHTLDKKSFEFRFVGPIANEANELMKTLQEHATFIPKQPHYSLPSFYAWGDIFLLPSIQDGFQTVLAQATAGSLPIITTTNGAGLDLVENNVTGWVLPIRDAPSIINKLHWCHNHRSELATMVEHTYKKNILYTWDDSATDFVKVARECIKSRA